MKIVILPGLDGTGLMLGSFIGALKNRYHVEVIRYPPDEVLSYSELTEHVSHKLPQTAPYIILAESFSGPIAVKIASEYVGNLKGIIFAASFLNNPTILPNTFGRLARFLPVKSSTLLRLAKSITFGKWSSVKLNVLLADAIKGVSHKVLVKRISELMRVDALKYLEPLELPMLYLRPSQDRLVRKSVATLMESRNERFQIQDIEGSHFILQTNEEACINAVTEFLVANT